MATLKIRTNQHLHVTQWSNPAVRFRAQVPPNSVHIMQHLDMCHSDQFALFCALADPVCDKAYFTIRDVEGWAWRLCVGQHDSGRVVEGVRVDE